MPFKINPKIPDELIPLMKDLAKNVIREQPNNINLFAAEYFERLLVARDGSLDGAYTEFRAYEEDYKRRHYSVEVKNKDGDELPLEVTGTTLKAVPRPRKQIEAIRNEAKGEAQSNEEAQNGRSISSEAISEQRKMSIGKVLPSNLNTIQEEQSDAETVKLSDTNESKNNDESNDEAIETDAGKVQHNLADDVIKTEHESPESDSGLSEKSFNLKVHETEEMAANERNELIDRQFNEIEMKNEIEHIEIETKQTANDDDTKSIEISSEKASESKNNQIYMSTVKPKDDKQITSSLLHAETKATTGKSNENHDPIEVIDDKMKKEEIFAEENDTKEIEATNEGDKSKANTTKTDENRKNEENKGVIKEQKILDIKGIDSEPSFVENETENKLQDNDSNEANIVHSQKAKSSALIESSAKVKLESPEESESVQATITSESQLSTVDDKNDEKVDSVQANDVDKSDKRIAADVRHSIQEASTENEEKEKISWAAATEKMVESVAQVDEDQQREIIDKSPSAEIATESKPIAAIKSEMGNESIQEFAEVDPNETHAENSENNGELIAKVEEKDNSEKEFHAPAEGKDKSVEKLKETASNAQMRSENSDESISNVHNEPSSKGEDNVIKIEHDISQPEKNHPESDLKINQSETIAEETQDKPADRLTNEAAKSVETLKADRENDKAKNEESIEKNEVEKKPEPEASKMDQNKSGENDTSEGRNEAKSNEVAENVEELLENEKIEQKDIQLSDDHQNLQLIGAQNETEKAATERQDDSREINENPPKIPKEVKQNTEQHSDGDDSPHKITAKTFEANQNLNSPKSAFIDKETGEDKIKIVDETSEEFQSKDADSTTIPIANKTHGRESNIAEKESNELPGNSKLTQQSDKVDLAAKVDNDKPAEKDKKDIQLKVQEKSNDDNELQVEDEVDEKLTETVQENQIGSNENLPENTEKSVLEEAKTEIYLNENVNSKLLSKAETDETKTKKENAPTDEVEDKSFDAQPKLNVNDELDENSIVAHVHVDEENKKDVEKPSVKLEEALDHIENCQKEEIKNEEKNKEFPSTELLDSTDKNTLETNENGSKETQETEFVATHEKSLNEPNENESKETQDKPIEITGKATPKATADQSLDNDEKIKNAKDAKVEKKMLTEKNEEKSPEKLSTEINRESVDDTMKNEIPDKSPAAESGMTEIEKQTTTHSKENESIDVVAPTRSINGETNAENSPNSSNSKISDANEDTNSDAKDEANSTEDEPTVIMERTERNSTEEKDSETLELRTAIEQNQSDSLDVPLDSLDVLGDRTDRSIEPDSLMVDSKSYDSIEPKVSSNSSTATMNRPSPLSSSDAITATAQVDQGGPTKVENGKSLDQLQNRIVEKTTKVSTADALGDPVNDKNSYRNMNEQMKCELQVLAVEQPSDSIQMYNIEEVDSPLTPKPMTDKSFDTFEKVEEEASNAKGKPIEEESAKNGTENLLTENQRKNEQPKEEKNAAIAAELASSDISDTETVEKAMHFVESGVDETSRDERDEMSEIENFDFSSCGEDSLEAMYYRIRKDEIVSDKRRASLKSLPNEDKISFPEKATEDLDHAIREVSGKKMRQSSDSTNDVVMQRMPLTSIEQSSTNENEEKPSDASNESEVELKRLESDDCDRSEGVKTGDDDDAVEEQTDFFPGDVKRNEFSRGALTSIVSESDSEYFENATTARPRLVKDDFNISTVYEHMIQADSMSDTESATLESAATTIQAGARGFLARSRLRRTADTMADVDQLPTVENVTIDRSFDDLNECQKSPDHSTDEAQNDSVGTRRSILQRGDAVLVNSTPDENESKSNENDVSKPAESTKNPDTCKFQYHCLSRGCLCVCV